MSETERDDSSRKFIKPSSRGLFETIKSFVKEADMLRKGRINIALKLGHIHLFFENPMQKCITDI